jgi:hypothetical protein
MSGTGAAMPRPRWAVYYKIGIYMYELAYISFLTIKLQCAIRACTSQVATGRRLAETMGLRRNGTDKPTRPSLNRDPRGKAPRVPDLLTQGLHDEHDSLRSSWIYFAPSADCRQ